MILCIWLAHVPAPPPEHRDEPSPDHTATTEPTSPTGEEFTGHRADDSPDPVAVDPLKSLRRAFRPAIRILGSPAPGEEPVALEGLHIFTSQRPRITYHASRQDASMYIVQFSGPIQPAWKELVAVAGGRIRGYLPHHALSVEVDARGVKRLSREAAIRSIFPYEPSFKLQPFLASLVKRNDASLPDEVMVTLSLHAPGAIGKLSDDLSAQGVEVLDQGAGARWGWVRARVKLSEVEALAMHDQVQWIEEYVPPRIVNDQAVAGPHMNVTNVWFGRGLTGAGQIIGHADTGLDVGQTNSIHPDFAGRIVAAFDLGRPGRWDDPDGHGTHTAGSIVGGGVMSTGQFRGVAFDARLVHQSVLDAYGGLGGLPLDLNDLYRQAYTNGARIHADSWGSSVYGYYSIDARQTDEFMWDHPDMLVVFAAGNDGWDSGDGVVDGNSVGSPATAKNVLSVGASEGDRPPGSGGLSSRTYGSLWPWDFSQSPIYGDYVSQSYDLLHQGIAAFSSRGPADDGRIKPEVVAPGTDIVSTRSKQAGAGAIWGAHPNSHYAFGGGTSMSTPLVAGAAALVRQYFDVHAARPNPSAALVKAALMHGARTLAPGQYGTNEFREIPPVRPNSVEGFGQIDVEGSLFPADASWFFADEASGLTAPGEVAAHVFYAATGTVKVTLNYTDFPAIAGAGVKLVNDLDLSVGAEAPLDRLNPFEHVMFNVDAPGIFTARVEAVNVPSGPQPYALLVSGPVIDAPRILHDPFPNQFETNGSYLITARILSSVPLAGGAVRLGWRVAPATNYTMVVMTNVSPDLFEARLPAQPMPSTVDYFISASNAAFVVHEPPGAPVSPHSFLVTQPLRLVVSGSPAMIYEVDPPYGTNLLASGNAITLSAPSSSPLSPGVRVAIDGWTGTGSVPATGGSNRVTITITNDSSINWNWVTQYTLTQTSTIAGVLSPETWHHAWSPATTITAATELVIGGAPFGLAGWRVDGVRHPGAGVVSENPAAGIVMFGPRTAEAVYLPRSQDSNSNNLPDWWEQFYFGTNQTAANIDSDDDGFTNGKEYQDRTNPRDGSSIPQAPSITHIPLANPQATPAPWETHATITDNHAISNAVLFWQRDGGAWTSVVMNAGASNLFTATIPPPGTNGHAFAYRIEAVDFAGLKVVTGPYSFSVAYPLMEATPLELGTIDVLAGATRLLPVAITNGGLAPLAWTMSRAVFYDDMERGSNRWQHAGPYDVWHLNEARHVSASRAWHFGQGPGSTYPDSSHGWLDMEPVHLVAPAQLIFEHWARMEYDYEQMDDHYWDGAIVELSMDGGTNYFAIEPVGGYPHRITDNPASPFAPDTPCYGETEGWETAIFDLSSFAGETVHLRFRFGADAYVTEEGWYIDNVRVVYDDEASWSWLHSPAAGSVAPQRNSNAVVVLDSAPLAYGERRSGVLVLEGNDPLRTGPLLIPLGIHNATREIVITSSGAGEVSPAGSLLVRYGDDVEVSAEAAEFHVIAGVLTNGYAMPGYDLMASAILTWPDIQTNGSLHVVFGEDMILGRVPAAWLYAEGFTNDTFDVEAATDHDGDGMLTWQEYLAGTDPHTSTSVAVKILSVAPDASGVVLAWLSYTNMSTRYTLEYASALAGGFTPVATNLPGTPPVNVFTNLIAPPFQFYRILTD